MLDGEPLADVVAFERVDGREVVRVQVVDDELGSDREELLEMPHAGAKRFQRLPVAQVADVMADPDPAPLGEAERVLELGPAGEDGLCRRDRQLQAARRVAARAADQQRRLADLGRQRAHDRVVDPGLDRAVVDEEGVGDLAEPGERVSVVVGDRLVGDVARGQHQRDSGVGGEQVMKRRVGQHHAEVGRARRDLLGDRRFCAGGGRSRSGALGPRAAPARPPTARSASAPPRRRRRAAPGASRHGACAHEAAPRRRRRRRGRPGDTPQSP